MWKGQQQEISIEGKLKIGLPASASVSSSHDKKTGPGKHRRIRGAIIFRGMRVSKTRALKISTAWITRRWSSLFSWREAKVWRQGRRGRGSVVSEWRRRPPVDFSCEVRRERKVEGEERGGRRGGVGTGKGVVGDVARRSASEQLRLGWLAASFIPSASPQMTRRPLMTPR